MARLNNLSQFPDPANDLNRGLVGYTAFPKEKPGCCFHGHFADMCMWGRPLSIKEIEQVHKNEKAGAMQSAVKRGIKWQD